MTHRPEPPAGVYVRDSNRLLLWRQAHPGDWVAVTGEYRFSASWEELDSGKHGDLELLVPVPYVTEPAAGDNGRAAVMRHVVEAVLNPVAEMMQQLAQAAGSGITAIVAETYIRGQQDALNAALLDDAREAANG